MDCKVKVEGLLEIIELVAQRAFEKDRWADILERVAKLFSADVAVLGIVEDDYVYYRNVSAGFRTFIPDYDPEVFRVSIFRGALSEALKTGVVVVEDYQEFPKAVTPWKEAGLRSVVITPLGDKEPIGSLAIARISSDQPFTEEDGKILKALAVIFSFVIKEEVEKRKLLEKAIKDHLTNLYNRFFLEEEGRREIEVCKRYGYPLSVVLFDIDNFKQINDRFGHRMGDLVLKKFASVLKTSLRSTDIPCRYGGEEFVVLMPHTYPEEAVKAADRVRMRFSQKPINLEGHLVRVTVSGGVAGCCSEECSLEDLLEKADKAMYEAKRLGKNRIVIYTKECAR